MWDVARGTLDADLEGRTLEARLEGRLEGQTEQVNTLCALMDGRLASGSEDKTIRLWDVAAGSWTTRLKRHTASVNALCLLLDGRLASGSDDHTIRLWDVATGAETARLELDAAVRAIVAIAPDLLIAGDQHGLHWLEVLD